MQPLEGTQKFAQNESKKKTTFSPIMKLIFFFTICILAVFFYILKHEADGTEVHRSRKEEVENEGYWMRTSNVDWCEPNYSHSYFVAETYNSISSLIFVAIAIWAWVRDNKLLCDPKNPIVTHSFHFKMRLAYFTLAIVGIGSFLFHATLTWYMQILDELPMIYTILSFCFILETFFDHHAEIHSIETTANNRNSSNNTNNNNSDVSNTMKWQKRIFEQHRNYVGHILFVVAIIGTLLELLFPTRPEIFQFFFVGLVIYAIIQSVRLYQIFHDFPSIQYLLEVSLLCFCSACAVWVSEPFLCHQIGWLQLHSVWHVGSATGLAFYLKFCQDIVVAQNKKRQLKEAKSVLPSVKETTFIASSNNNNNNNTHSYLRKNPTVNNE